MNPLDNKLANSQIGFTVLLLLIIAFVIIWLETHGVPHLDGEQLKEFTTWNGWLRNLGMLAIGAFWFNRNRAGGIPDQTITQTHTSPDGTVTSIKSPAHLPPPPFPTAGAPTPEK